MTSRRWLFALLLAVPVFGFCVSSGVHAHLNSELESALRNQRPDVSADELSIANVDLLCAESRLSSETFCETNQAIALLSQTSLWAAGVGLLLVFSIWVAGRLAQRNRVLLVLLFRPGLYLTVLSLVGLILTHAGIAMAAIYFGESAITNRIHGGIILMIGLGAAGGVFAMARGAFSLVKKAQITVVGRSIARADAPLMWDAIEKAAGSLHSLKPDHIVFGLDANFFVTEADVLCLTGRLRGRTLYCSLPLCRILSKPEFFSIVGHELGHFRGKDTKFSEHFYPIYRGTASALKSLESAGGDGAGAVGLLPAIAILSYFFECFSTAENQLSREREFVADGAGAELTSATVMATALLKIHAFSSIWNDFDSAAASALRDGKFFRNASMLFAGAVAENASPASFDGIADTHLAHPTDSHPPLAARLKSLNQELTALTRDALEVSPETDCLSFLPGPEETEEEISGVYQLLLARRLGIAVKDSETSS